jgi:hypothetical protein
MARLPSVHAAATPVWFTVDTPDRSFKCGFVAVDQSTECSGDGFDVLVWQPVDFVVITSEIGDDDFDTQRFELLDWSKGSILECPTRIVCNPKSGLFDAASAGAWYWS